MLPMITPGHKPTLCVVGGERQRLPDRGGVPRRGGSTFPGSSSCELARARFRDRDLDEAGRDARLPGVGGSGRAVAGSAGATAGRAMWVVAESFCEPLRPRPRCPDTWRARTMLHGDVSRSESAFDPDLAGSRCRIPGSERLQAGRRGPGTGRRPTAPSRAGSGHLRTADLGKQKDDLDNRET